MKNKNRQKTETSSFSWDSLLKLLPLLAQNYPGVASMLGQLAGNTQSTSGQFQEALPKIIQAFTEMDPQTKEDLAKQLVQFIPELESLLNKQGESSDK